MSLPSRLPKPFPAVLLMVSQLLSSPALACACCGNEHSWFDDTVTLDDYMAQVIAGLQFTNGGFDDSPLYEADYAVDRIKAERGKISFVTGKGVIVFHYGDTAYHRTADITFITDKSRKAVDMADIYHELILVGTLAVPQGIIADYGGEEDRPPLRPTMQAKMILQGLGTACVEPNTFARWLIKPADVLFTGYGDLAGWARAR